MLSISLQGGITGTFSDFNGCGASGPILSWSNFNPIGADPTGLGVSFSFMGITPPLDQIGTFPLADVTVTELRGDAGTRDWEARDGCSVNVEGSICSPTQVFSNRRVLSGSVMCTQALAPGLGNTEAPITILDFKFVGFINPRPGP
jgi:hypothetical protein